MPFALFAPDSARYRLLALGDRAAVPAPFSARILAPAIAGWLGRFTGLGVDRGFVVLGAVCLTALIGLIAAYLWSWRAPAAIYAAIFLMPFWADIFHDYYLPDLLHAVLLALILVCLLNGYTTLGLLLLFPAFLARESTILVALCLIPAAWRRIPVASAAVGGLAVVAGRMVGAHFTQNGPTSVHGLSGGAYILGKLVWSLFKNVLGLPLWSNTLPECVPVWSSTLPRQAHFGAIHVVGLCQPSLWGPGRMALAWFGVFGIGPACAMALWRTLRLPVARELTQPASGNATPPLDVAPGTILVFRFCLIYGLISILMTPLLGASVDRLAAYAWPFYFVLLPWFLSRYGKLPGYGSAGLLCLHLVTGWLAWFGFRQQTTPIYVLSGLAVLIANALAFYIWRGYRFGYFGTPSNHW